MRSLRTTVLARMVRAGRRAISFKAQQHPEYMDEPLRLQLTGALCERVTNIELLEYWGDLQ